mgnify:CR=1 FL=1
MSHSKSVFFSLISFFVFMCGSSLAFADISREVAELTQKFRGSLANVTRIHNGEELIAPTLSRCQIQIDAKKLTISIQGDASGFFDAPTEIQLDRNYRKSGSTFVGPLFRDKSVCSEARLQYSLRITSNEVEIRRVMSCDGERDDDRLICQY